MKIYENGIYRDMTPEEVAEFEKLVAEAPTPEPTPEERIAALEEPPSYVIFILATTEAHKIPITILSRCQRYDFRRITVDTISDRLSELMEKEGTEVEEKAIRYIAKAADGSMRDALSLLDQCIAFYLGEKLTYEKALDVLGAVDMEVFSELLRKVLAQDTAGSIKTLEELIVQGRELGQFVNDFVWYMRNLLLVKTSDVPEDAVDVSAENLERLKEESEMLDTETLMRYIRVFSELSNQIRYASQKRVLVEIALIKLCQPVMETNLDSLFDRIRVLEEKMEKGIPVLTESQKASTRALPQPELFGEEAQDQEAVKPQKETAIMQIQVNLTQKKNVCTSAYAIYSKNEQTLEMSGNPKIVQNGDTFRAQVILLDMETQEITLTGRVKGSVSTAESSKPEQKNSAEPKTESNENEEEKEEIPEEQNGIPE